MAFLLLWFFVVRAHPFYLRRHLGREEGFTLVEILIACAIIGIGLVPVSWAFTMAVQGVETGRQQSTAVFLAQQRMDQVKDVALIGTEPPLKYVTAAAFPAEPYGTLANASGFRRTVTLSPPPYLDIQIPAGGAVVGKGMRVDVDVFYRPITAGGAATNERSVRLSSVLAIR